MTESSTHPSSEAAARGLPPLGVWVVMLVFGVVTVRMIASTEDPGAARADLLLFGAGVGCIAAALAWFFVVALQRSLVWSLVLLVPVLNTLALPIFVRMYWSDGTRWPALLALLGFAGELAGSLRILLSSGPQLI